MNKLRALIFSGSVLLIAAVPAAAGVLEPGAMVIRQVHGAYEVSVPVSRLVASIPRGNLVLGKNSAGDVGSSRYFFLEDTVQNLIVSGWFEPGERFPGLREFWEGETAKWEAGGLPAPQAVSFARISDWEAILYDVALPFGSNSHIRAHWVQAGTWIDLHLSVANGLTAAENRANLKRVLKSVRVRQKE